MAEAKIGGICNKTPWFTHLYHTTGRHDMKNVSETKEWKHKNGNILGGFSVRAVSKVLKHYATTSTLGDNLGEFCSLIVFFSAG